MKARTTLKRRLYSLLSNYENSIYSLDQHSKELEDYKTRLEKGSYVVLHDAELFTNIDFSLHLSPSIQDEFYGYFSKLAYSRVTDELDRTNKKILRYTRIVKKLKNLKNFFSRNLRTLFRQINHFLFKNLDDTHSHISLNLTQLIMNR